MAIDLLRSCYSTIMAIHNNAPTQIPIFWYFVPDGTPIFPGYTLFASGNWASSKDGWFGPGEVQGAPRPWRDGSGPTDLLKGDHFCGTLKMFAEGGSVEDDKLCTNLAGVSSCCGDFVFCCDLAKFPHFITLTVLAATPGVPIPSTIGYPGLTFLMERTVNPLIVEYETVTGVFLPPALNLFTFTLQCLNDVITLTSNPGIFGSVIPLNNAKRNPPGIRFWPASINMAFSTGFSAETWTLALGTDPGWKPPPASTGPTFPRGTFPPGTFAPQTFA